MLPLSSFYPRRINRVRGHIYTHANGVQSKCKICDDHDRTLRRALKRAGAEA